MIMRQHKGCLNPYSTSQIHFIATSYITCYRCHPPSFGTQYRLTSCNVTLRRHVVLDLQRIENVYNTDHKVLNPLSMSRKDMHDLNYIIMLIINTIFIDCS